MIIGYRKGQKLSALLLAGACALAGIERTAAQSPAPTQTSESPGDAASASVPSFEVATIKPGTNDDRQMMMFTPDGISVKGVHMQMILREAFGTEDDHVI